MLKCGAIAGAFKITMCWVSKEVFIRIQLFHKSTIFTYSNAVNVPLKLTCWLTHAAISQPLNRTHKCAHTYSESNCSPNPSLNPCYRLQRSYEESGNLCCGWFPWGPYCRMWSISLQSLIIPHNVGHSINKRCRHGTFINKNNNKKQFPDLEMDNKINRGEYILKGWPCGLTPWRKAWCDSRGTTNTGDIVIIVWNS